MGYTNNAIHDEPFKYRANKRRSLDNVLRSLDETARKDAILKGLAYGAIAGIVIGGLAAVLMKKKAGK